MCLTASLSQALLIADLINIQVWCVEKESATFIGASRALASSHVSSKSLHADPTADMLLMCSVGVGFGDYYDPTRDTTQAKRGTVVHRASLG